MYRHAAGLIHSIKWRSCPYGQVFLIGGDTGRIWHVQDVHADLWKGANRKFDKIPWRKVEMERHNAERTPEQQVSTCMRDKHVFLWSLLMAFSWGTLLQHA